MATGTVKCFGGEKGIGFVTPDDQGKGLFVYSSGIAGGGFRSLTEGAKVSYDAAPHGAERREPADDLNPRRLLAPGDGLSRRPVPRQNADIYGHRVGRLGSKSGCLSVRSARREAVCGSSRSA
jgi:CspA family cold shock protein